MTFLREPEGSVDLDLRFLRTPGVDGMPCQGGYEVILRSRSCVREEANNVMAAPAVIACVQQE